MLATGIALLVFPLLEAPLLPVVLAFILGLGLGGAQPMIMALLYDRARRAEAGKRSPCAPCCST